MGKRTKALTGKTHAPRPRDLWRTIDPRAIPPLLPHLPAGARYAEPMAGGGDLIRMLAPHIACAWATDLEPQAGWVDDHVWIAQGDALTCELGDADLFISNPPWTRPLLHKLIIHLSNQAPTWLLYDSDWLHTAQASPFMERCRKVVQAPRLIWIPGTTNAGFTACSWYLFDKPLAGSSPAFYGLGCRPPESRRSRRICADCGVLIDRFGKWALVERGGLPTPVHKDCARPSSPGQNPELAPTPLLDWGGA